MPDLNWAINPLNPATTAECELCEELILSSQPERALKEHYKKCPGTRGAPSCSLPHPQT